MKQQIKKYLKYALVGFAGLMILGFAGSLFESWAVVPSYTPPSFLEDVKRAEALNATNHFTAKVQSSDVSYNYNQRGRGAFYRPTLCSKGTLYQHNTSRTSTRCNKSFTKHYELASTDNSVFDQAIASIKHENWAPTATAKDYQTNLDRMVASGNGTLRFKNDRLSLTLTSDNKQVCVKDNLNEFFCHETKPGVAAFVTVTISADYSDF